MNIRVCVAALVPMLAFGQVDARAKKIVDDAITALGGPKFLTMQDRIESGRAYSFYHEQLSGLSIAKIYTRYQTVATGKTGEELAQRERQSFGKNEDTSIIFREDGGFDVGFRGSKPLPADRVERYRLTTLHNVFYILRQRLSEPGMLIESRGVDVIDNVPVENVEFIDSENRSVLVSFHRSTKLPVQQKWVWRDTKSKDRAVEVTRFSRYRDANGVQWPHQILRERDGEKIYEMFSDSVVIGKDIPDSTFAVSAAAIEATPTQHQLPTRKK